MTVPFQPVELLVETPLSDVLSRIATVPPALTRLEPQSVSGDPRPGAEALTADPLWMLGRQWQLGELQGEDVGTPVAVHVRRRALPVTAWAPGGHDDAYDWRPWPAGALLDELVEHVPHAGAERGLRWRAETGQQLLEMLRESGLDEQADELLAAHPLTLPTDPADPTGALDPTADRLLAVLAGAVPDGAAARAALEGGRPSWASGAAEVTSAWSSWVAGPEEAGGAWSTPRFEHRFRLRFGTGRDAVVLQATAFGSGAARWHHFSWLPDEHVTLRGERPLSAPAESEDVLLATALRYPGMPADRYWQLEDGVVDVAAVEAQPHDLARLCLAEFAMVTGDDWLVVPVDADPGAVNQVLEVAVTTTFGERIVVPEAAESRSARGFRMFEVLSEDGRALHGVVLPPSAVTPLSGDAVEEVALLRDESANLAWAVERIVPGRSGDPRSRADEPGPARTAPPTDLAAGDLVYELQAPVPRHWLPLVPVVRKGQITLRKGAMLDGDSRPLEAAGVLLRPTPLDVPEEEVPREGLVVRAVPLLARRPDGSYARWTGHRVSVGRGSASSGLAYDAARPVR